jgi:type 1 fimbriae regulatory protein FimB/type 1 fimbriae regulatory protein FimE
VEEAANLKWEQVDFASGNIHVRRIKRGTPSTQPLGGDEMRGIAKAPAGVPDFALRLSVQPQRTTGKRHDRGHRGASGVLAALPFPTHPHMLRHGTGYYLANKGVDTRTIQAYLGHCNIQHTVRYTELAPGRFKGLWND